jgi:hypothetical protein
MTRTLKTDFHLHTHHSDNRDRMTPTEYVGLARRFGYDVLGFCDHHQNLTQAKWDTLQQEVAAEIADLSGEALLLTTGYEATWMTGHLCVLGKQIFDGESIVDCDRQMWSLENTRILAHPDNNLCAWRLPLPVGVQGVEVINGGQDPYSTYVGSPCNGLATFQRYLLLNHKVAAIAQSDCHQRAIFGRAWTGIIVDDDAPLRWEKVQAALFAGHTYAVMGDLPIRVWMENDLLPGDSLVEQANGDDANTLLWEVPSGAEVTVFVADRPLAHFAGTASSRGHYRIHHNGPHWLLVKRGLAWAVSSPVWVSNQPVESAPIRAALVNHSAVQQMADSLRRSLEWMANTDLSPEQTPYPVAAYIEWLGNQLPAAWKEEDVAFTGPGDPVDWAMARLHAARAIAVPILRDLLRVHHRARIDAHHRSPALPGESGHIAVSALQAPLPSGLYRATVDLPYQWPAPVLATLDGEEVLSMASTIVGERDPLHGERSRVQMNELVIWLDRGEIHEYELHNSQLTLVDGTVRLVCDLWPAALGNGPEPRSDLASKLAAAIADPEVQRFFVHLRMPKRYDIIFELAQQTDANPLVLAVLPSAGNADPETDKRTLHFFADDALANDPSLLSMTVQLT